jgi:hypothetical protein
MTIAGAAGVVVINTLYLDGLQRHAQASTALTWSSFHRYIAI